MIAGIRGPVTLLVLLAVLAGVLPLPAHAAPDDTEHATPTGASAQDEDDSEGGSEDDSSEPTSRDDSDRIFVITGTRLSLDPLEQPYAFYRHDREKLDQAIGRTALDRIDYGPGVAIQHTAPAQTSPFIRGLTGKQSLLLLDGVRLSHATMRGGPNEYAAFVPDMSIGSIDVILGSSSVVNGSDGLTGAIDFRLAETGRGVTKIASPWSIARVDSANGVQFSAGVDGTSSAWRYTVEASLYDFHDRVGGKNQDHNIFGGGRDAYDEIPNTAYEQGAFAARAAYDGFEFQTLEFAFGHTRQEDARRPDGYFENSGISSRISRFYDPESFTYLHVRHTLRPQDGFVDRLTTTAWWHQFDEHQTREDLTSGGTVYRRREYDDRIDSVGAELQATSFLGDSHELTYGIFTLFECTTNDYAEFRNPGGTDPAGQMPFNASTWSQNTNITDGAEYNTYALYVQDLWNIDERFSLLSGLRYTYVEWDFDVADGDTDDLTGSLRGSYRLRDDMMTFVGVSKAFRAPNLNDLDGATDRGSSGTPSFGNPDLDPEVAYSVEAGWRYYEGRDQLAVSAFYTTLDDVIQSVFPPGGGSGMLENGKSAWLRGFEVLWDYGLPVSEEFGERLSLYGSVSLVDTEARVPQSDGTTLEEPFSRSNRLYGVAGIRCDVDHNWWAKTQVRFHDRYDSDDINSGDSGDVRLTVPGRPNGTVPGFAVFDISVGWRSDDRNRWVSLNVENIGDRTYRPLGSGADAPGLNFGLVAGVRF